MSVRHNLTYFRQIACRELTSVDAIKSSLHPLTFLIRTRCWRIYNQSQLHAPDNFAILHDIFMDATYHERGDRRKEKCAMRTQQQNYQYLFVSLIIII